MLLVTSNLCDVLTPGQNSHPDLAFYENFVAQYSEIAVSAIVAQVNLEPTLFDMPESEFNGQIDTLIEDIPTSAKKMRKAFAFLSMGAHIDQGELVQDKERRTFVSEYFTERSEKLGTTNREHVVNALNTSAYLSYFGLFEGILKSLHLQQYPGDKYKVGNKDVINKCLKSFTERYGMVEEFNNELRARSKFFTNFNVLELTWDLLNFIRNTQAHQNSNYGENEKKKINEKYEGVINGLVEQPNNELVIELFTYSLDPIMKQVKEHGFLQFNNTLENFVRNTTVFVMESLYVCLSSKLGTN